MLTAFGKFSRKLRIDNGELLKDMADKLEVTSSYLSAIENGKRNVPRNWVNIISELYSLDEEQIEELKLAINQSQINTKVNLKGMENSDKDLMMALARKIDKLNKEEKNIIKNILLKK